MKLNMDLDIGNSASASDWVKQSRIKETIDKSKALRMAEQQRKKLEEEEMELLQQKTHQVYGMSDLKGLRVKHADSDFEAGQQVILTLADSDLLETDEHGKAIGINEEYDMLENVNFADTDRRLEREKRIKRNLQPVYSALDDDQFKEGVAPGSRAVLLAQYDKEQKVQPKMQIGDNGVVLASAHNIQSSTRDNSKLFGDAQSLQMELKGASDYFTPQEYATFSKARSGNKDRKKLRRTRKRDDNDDEIVEAAEATSNRVSEGVDDGNAMDVDIAPQNESSSTDRGARGSGESKTQLELLAEEEAKKKHNYNLAVQRAAETSKLNPKFNPELPGASSQTAGGEITFDHSAYQQQVRQQQKSSSSFASLKRGEILSLDLDQEDPEMVQALAKARRIAIQQRLQQEKNATDLDGTKNTFMDDKGALLARSVISQMQHATAAKVVDMGVAEAKRSSSSADSSAVIFQDEDEEDNIDAEGRRADGKLVFNSTTEFTTRLQARLNDKARNKAELAFKDLERASSAAQVAHSASVGEKRAHSEAVDGEDVMEEDAEDIYHDGDLLGAAEQSDSEGEDSLDDEQMAFLHRQPLVAKGMAATLALLKGSGELKVSEELAGRAKDKRAIDPSAADFDVKLEYRDDHGRKLTQKEAFRQLSYRFHGYGPGQKKKEKRLKAIEVQTKASTSRAGILDGNGGMMGSFAKAQEATGKAHITIQGGANSGGAVSAASLAAMMAKKK